MKHFFANLNYQTKLTNIIHELHEYRYANN